jgi:hypothetical protein
LNLPLARQAALMHAWVRRRPAISRLSYTGRRDVADHILLPFATDIPVRSYLNQAFPLSIVVDNPHYSKVLFGNFIQLFFPDHKLDYDRVLMFPCLLAEDWAQLGFLDLLAVDTHTRSLSRPADLINLIIEHVFDRCYVETWIDEYFLPGRSCYHSIHSVHDNLIIGYDLDQRHFHLAGQGRDYEVSHVCFEDIAKSFHYMPKGQLKKRFLRFIRARRNVDYEFDVQKTTTYIQQYLDSAPTLTASAMRRAELYWKVRRFTGTWGLRTYQTFTEYLKRMSEANTPIDLRATRTLWEHKACMLARLKFLESANCLSFEKGFSDMYAPVADFAKMLRFQAYEYNTSGLNLQLLPEMVEMLNAMETCETSVLRNVYSSLRTGNA